VLPADRLLPMTATSTRVSSISLRHAPMTCATCAVPGEPGVSRHLTRRSGLHHQEGGISSCPLGVLPTSGCSRRTTHSRSRLPRGEPRRRSALAEDPRESRRDRFHRRSVKTAGFPDLEHLRPMSTLLGVFLRADGFATTARHLVDLLPGRDESHPASPLATPREVSLSRCFARTDDAHRLLQYD
jgi:hypothetical protein